MDKNLSKLQIKGYRIISYAHTHMDKIVYNLGNYVHNLSKPLKIGRNLLWTTPIINYMKSKNKTKF